jgi:hypothetical protein
MVQASQAVCVCEQNFRSAGHECVSNTTCAPCPPGQGCDSTGECKTCEGAEVVCANVCTDTTTDVLNCGACGQACDIGADWCTLGNCLTDHAWAIWPMPNVGDYTVTADTVRDNVTGLLWQRTPTQIYWWSDAVAYCENLTLGAYSDWRLPTRIELVSIVDYGSISPAIDSGVFPGTPLMLFWSSSLTAWAGASAWAVDFNVGNVSICTRNSATAFGVRCVR